MNKDILKAEIVRSKISDDALMLLCSQYHIILKSGLTAQRATKLLSWQVEDKKLKKILENVLKDIDSGKSLSYAFEKYGSGAFSRTFFETIKAGEHSGNLANSFATLEEYYKKQSKISKQIKSALIYPVFVLVISVIVLIVIMAYVMPQLVGIFENMGGEIPVITTILISVSNFFSNNLFLIIISLILIILIFKIYSKTEKGKLKIDNLKLKLPIFGKINLYNNSATFATTLSMLLSSGIVLSKALKILSGVFENKVFKDSSARLSKIVDSGKSLVKGMRREECIPVTLTEMVGIGEETGEIEEILKTIGEYYLGEAENATKNMISKLEPTILVFVAALAGFIVFAIYIPLFQMYDLF